MGFFDFFRSGPTPPASAPETETVRKIVDSLEHMDTERARYLAAFAYILSRVARADLKVSPEESRIIEQQVREHGGLTEDQAILVSQIARHQQILFGATEDFLVTREFNRISTREQKLQLLDCLYAVAAAEARVTVVEDNEIRKIASELGLEHPEIIAVRSRYREHLAVLRQPDQP
jgi:uncharacterized tellurite resistance protein B-like protein